MNQNNVVFSAANMISTLGIQLNENCNVVFEQNPSAIDITSSLCIEQKEKSSNYYMVTENFENSDNPGYLALFSTNLTNDGVVTLKLDVQHPDMISLMELVNLYLRFFMVIESRRGFHVHEYVKLEIMTDYTVTDTIVLDKIHLYNLTLISPFETGVYEKEINIEYVVNTYLKTMGADRLDCVLDTNDLLIKVTMQKTVEDMVLI